MAYWKYISLMFLAAFFFGGIAYAIGGEAWGLGVGCCIAATFLSTSPPSE